MPWPFKRRRKEVSYEELGKGQAFHLKIDFKEKRYDVVAVQLPIERQVDTQAGVTVSTAETGIAVNVDGKRNRSSKGPWEAFIHSSEYGLLPLQEWKERNQLVLDKVANTINTATGSNVKPDDIQLRTTIPPDTGVLPCPRCGHLMPLDSEDCPNCGQRIPYYY